MNKYILVLIIAVFASCKRTKNTTLKGNKLKTEVKKNNEQSEEDKKIDQILNNGKVATLNGEVNLIVNKNEILIFLPKTTENETARYFLHIDQKRKEKLILDFDVKKANLQNLNKYENYFVCYKNIKNGINTSKPYSINIGKIDKEKGRLWSNFFFTDKMKTNYDYRFYKNIDIAFKSAFEEEFEEALDDGFFIKSIDGFDLLFNNQIVYFIKQNASEEVLKTRFFLHAGIEGTTKQKNLDFNFDQFKKYVRTYPKVSIAKVNLGDDAISFTTGQFNDSGRTWSVSYLIEEVVNNASFVYDNQYD